ncbi:hypothetical protein ACFU7Y_41280 [Kitasatospora sp. NPDC057542]|uniref:hypothetical protein n=1 Tax=Streptomycetaceae TaxID=2062 RepID=UPI001CCB5D78|nr:hypothetical protein [Streptomyces sp. LS1784]
MSSIEFVRRLDGLVYRFDEDGSFNGRPSFRRRDLDLWCRWVPGRGWCVVDAEGVPDSGPLPGGSRHQEHPPTGPWRSWKAGKSHLYDLRRVDGDTR